MATGYDPIRTQHPLNTATPLYNWILELPNVTHVPPLGADDTDRQVLLRDNRTQRDVMSTIVCGKLHADDEEMVRPEGKGKRDMEDKIFSESSIGNGRQESVSAHQWLTVVLGGRGRSKVKGNRRHYCRVREKTHSEGVK